MEAVPAQQEAIERASQLVAQSRYLVALVGAGLSAESGIPTYRGEGGLWTRFGEPDPKNYQALVQDPKGWWERQLAPELYERPERAEMRRALEGATPNAGHYALVDLESMGALKHIITQNVDNLHRAAGSRNVAEIHGNRTLLRCMECHLRLPRDQFEVVEVPPHCPECGGIIKGDTVMFGEQIPPDVLRVCFEQTERCDCMLVLGTSGTVYPAAEFPLQARRDGAALIEVNTAPTPITDMVDVALRGPSGELLPPIVARVAELVAERKAQPPPV